MRYSVSLILLFSLLLFASGGAARAQRSASAPPQSLNNLQRPLALLWQFPTKNVSGLSPALWQNKLYLPLTNGEVVALRADDGQLLWKSDIGGRINAAPYADERALYVASAVTQTSKNESPKNSLHTETENASPIGGETTPRGFVRALANTSGVTLWTRALPLPFTKSLIADEERIYGVSADRWVYALRKTDGAVEWKTLLPRPIAANPFLSKEKIYLLDQQGAIYALDAASGKTLWRYQTRPTARGALIVAEETLFYGTDEGRIFALRDEDGKRLWQARVGGGIVSLTPTDRGLLVASLDNFVYLLSTRHGDRLWKTQLDGRIEAPPLVSDGAALFAPLSGDACVVLSLRDGKLSNALPVGDENNTAAAPVLAADVLVITTRTGLMAFASTTETKTEKKIAGTNATP